jgi:hypothetical protein
MAAAVAATVTAFQVVLRGEDKKAVFKVIVSFGQWRQGSLLFHFGVAHAGNKSQNQKPVSNRAGWLEKQLSLSSAAGE